MTPLANTIETKQTKIWSFRKNEKSQNSKMAWQTKTRGKRPKGRPRNTWEDGIKNILKERKLE